MVYGIIQFGPKTGIWYHTVRAQNGLSPCEINIVRSIFDRIIMLRYNCTVSSEQASSKDIMQYILFSMHVINNMYLSAIYVYIFYHNVFSIGLTLCITIYHQLIQSVIGWTCSSHCNSFLTLQIKVIKIVCQLSWNYYT